MAALGERAQPAHGGKRPGAGRKAKAEKHAGVITRAEKRIADRLPELIENMLALAGGVFVERPARDGKDGAADDPPKAPPDRVYLTPPDRQANEYLINRILGRPTERAEVTGVQGGPVEVVYFYLPDNGRTRLSAEAGTDHPA
jgi:hypothetical protein